MPHPMIRWSPLKLQQNQRPNAKTPAQHHIGLAGVSDFGEIYKKVWNISRA